ncbi:hypothetical protein JCM8097_009070 [Rhodosporidiobolus ruineniae]
MAQALPLYLGSHPSSPASTHPPAADDSADDPSRLSFPASVHTLALDHPALARRDSFRPPLPPKPNSLAGLVMERSRSADSAVDPNGTALPDTSPALSDGALSATSPTTWMRAMLGGAEGGSPDLALEGENGAGFLPDGYGLGLPRSGARTPVGGVGNGGLSGPATPILGASSTLAFPARSREPPPVPPRPVTVSPPPNDDAPSPSYLDQPAATVPGSPSSAPPTSSPFLASASSGAFAPPPSHNPPPRRAVPSHVSSASSAPSVASSTHSSSTAPASAAAGVFSAVNRGLQQAKLRDRFGAGVGFAREWGGKGKNKVQDSWRGFHPTSGSGGHRAAASVSGTDTNSYGSNLPSSASSPQLDSASRTPLSPPLSSSPSIASFGPLPGGSTSTASTAALAIKLPTTILGTKVPSVRGVAFGTPLAPLVSSTRAPSSSSGVHMPTSLDEVTGSSARLWLPGIAFRCLEYLDLWGRKEEGIYRIPGRSNMVAQLRVMFDAGVGQEMDLREVPLGEVDPADVASLFKSWLRELPESLLSPTLEPLIDALTVSHLGYNASSSSFLSCAAPSSTPSSSSSTPVGLVDGRAPREYVETLREVFATRMEAENWHLLRAIAYHLARLSAHAATTKMTLGNLQLILSPTLRLTPGFVQVLVVEREILFSKANESARHREATASALSTPPLAQGAFSPSSPSLRPTRNRSPTPRSSPLLNPPSPRPNTATASLPHSSSATSAGSWLVIDDSHAHAPASAPPTTTSYSTAVHDTHRLSPIFVPSPTFSSPESLSPPPTLPSSAASTAPPTQRHSPQTPIADRFASISSASSLPGGAPSIRSLSNATSNLSLRDAASSSASTASGSSSAPPAIAPKPSFIPSRDRANGAGGGGFFGSRAEPVPAAASGGRNRSRKGSASSLPAPARAQTGPPSLGDVRVEPGRLSFALFNGGDGSTSAAPSTTIGREKEEQEKLRDHTAERDDEQERLASAGAAARRSRTGSRRSSSASSAGSIGSRGSVSGGSSFSASSVSAIGNGGGLGAGAGAGRPSTIELTLPMPSGLGIGLGFSSSNGAAQEELKTPAEEKSAAGAARRGGEDDGGWGLLSVEERRKLFGG